MNIRIGRTIISAIIEKRMISPTNVSPFSGVCSCGGSGSVVWACFVGGKELLCVCSIVAKCNVGSIISLYVVRHKENDIVRYCARTFH